jgi:hypothetical protein
MLHGTTIAHIHDLYSCSSSLYTSLKLLLVKRQLNTVVLATLSSVLSLSRGPFFQQALTMQNDTYTLNTLFMALGLSVSLINVIAILPLYYGYWELGRRVSLHPLEIARAFGAPVLDGLDGNVGAADVEMARGHVGVRYGAVERNGEEKVLRVEDMRRGNVRMPKEGEIFG